MPRKERPTFIVTLPLDAPPADASGLRSRLECAKRIYNVMLQEGLHIVAAIRNDERWTAARKLPKGPERNDAFRAVRDAHRFTEYAFHSLAVAHKNAAGFAGRIGSHETQSIAARVFLALEQYLLGKRGRPRFKGARRPLHSLEGKDNKGMLRWDAEARLLHIEKGWSIRVRLPNLRRDEWLAAALQFRTKYCRIVWKTIKGNLRWFVQLVQDGTTPIKASVLHRLAPEGSVGGLDIGPSTIAWVTDDEAGLQRFAPEVDRPYAEIRRLQRHIDRQRRVNNPGNYHPDGRARKGCRSWVRSLRQLQAERRLAEMYRYEAAVRKQAHGRDTNFLLGKARIWRDDGVSPKALQKRYGRSISVRAPGHFMSELTRKAERAAGQRQIINVRQLKTSQYDHTTNTFIKKPLSQRQHVFGDGRGRVQRDLYSAFLARNSEGNTHQPQALERAWHALESILLRAGWCDIKPQEAGSARPQSDFAVCQSGSPEGLVKEQQQLALLPV